MRKLVKMSLAAAVAVTGMVSSASADVDFKIGGQTVVYYNTNDAGDSSLFNQASSKANVGIQLNATGDIGHGTTLGFQATALNTMGLENKVVGKTMQSGAATGDITAKANDYFGMTKAYIAKTVGNTTVKMGRQELPQSLSPLAFTEGWNVVKNTFDAIVGINSSIENTTIVGAYVSRSNGHKDLTTYGKLHATTAGGAANLDKGAYMLTAAMKFDALDPTVSYYALNNINGADSGKAIWLDAKINADLPVKLAIQAGNINPSNSLDKTTAFGFKVNGKASDVAYKVAYTTVNDGAVAVKNVGTGVKTPLYTQMIANQNYISANSNTIVVQGVVPVGSSKVVAQYGSSSAKVGSGKYNELDMIYKFKALDMNMLAAFVTGKLDGADRVNTLRFVARYSF
jgi:hypothetical protein